MKRVIVILAAVCAFVAVAAASASAASISLDLASVPDGTVNFGDSFSFIYDTAPHADFSTIQLLCYQNGELVFSDARATYPGGYGFGVPFQAGPSAAWTSGAADCTGELGHRLNSGHFKVDASVDFAVAA